MSRSNNPFVRLLSLLLLYVVLVNSATAQRGGGHTLFGDFKVDDRDGNGLKPVSFHVFLYTASGGVVDRQTVTPGGRYRFMRVRNGEYDIIVEMENTEVARIRILLSDPIRTDIRQDISLEWRASSRGSRPAGTISAADSYERGSANRSRFERAESAIERKDYPEAVSLLTAIVSHDPEDFQAWTELGTACLFQEKQAEAEKAYLRATQVKPTFALAFINLGKLLSSQRKFEAAAVPLARALELRPTSGELNLLMGEVYLQMKKGSKAVGYLSEAVRLGSPDAHLRLAALYNAAGMKDKAADEYESFLKKKPDHPQKKKLEEYIAQNKKR